MRQGKHLESGTVFLTFKEDGMTDVIKVQFIKNGEPQGREYTYRTPVPVAVGDKVNVSMSQGIVTAVDVPEQEIARFGDKAKEIIGKVEEGG